MTNVINFKKWKRGRTREGARPRYSPKHGTDGLVSIGEISAEIVQKLME